MSEIERLRARVAHLEEQLGKAMTIGNLCPDCFGQRTHIHVCCVPGCSKQPCRWWGEHYCCSHVPTAPPMDEYIERDGVLYRAIDKEALERSPGLTEIQFTDDFRIS